MSAKLKGYAALFAAFALGIATGAAALHARDQRQFARLVGDRAGLLEGRRLVALARRLRLTDSQRDRIRDIMDGHVGERRRLMNDMYDRCGQELRAKELEVDAEVRDVLDPDQRRLYEQMIRGPRGRGFRY